jgi:hypothetical protein
VDVCVCLDPATGFFSAGLAGFIISMDTPPIYRASYDGVDSEIDTRRWLLCRLITKHGSSWVIENSRAWISCAIFYQFVPLENPLKKYFAISLRLRTRFYLACPWVRDNN